MLSFYRIDTKWSKKTSIKYIVAMFTFLCLFVGVKYYQQLITEGNTYRSEPAGLLENITENKENIFYVKKTSLGIDEELLFLRQNYDKNADAKQIEEYNGYSIYDFFINE